MFSCKIIYKIFVLWLFCSKYTFIMWSFCIIVILTSWLCMFCYTSRAYCEDYLFLGARLLCSTRLLFSLCSSRPQSLFLKISRLVPQEFTAPIASVQTSISVPNNGQCLDSSLFWVTWARKYEDIFHSGKWGVSEFLGLYTGVPCGAYPIVPLFSHVVFPLDLPHISCPIYRWNMENIPNK